MRISRRVRRSKWFKKFIAACLVSGMINFGFIPAASALPQGGSVQWGNIDINNPALIKMLSGSGAIINWDSFSIANGETVRFDFDLVNNAAVLNRVVKNNPSLIAGLLEATNNGKVVLVNPSGIVFGGGAQINTGSFVASTIDISDDTFKKFCNGETNLLQFRPNGVTSNGIEFTGDTYTNTTNLAFIGATIKVAPGVTISAGTPSSPIKDYGYIRLLAGKEADIRISSDSSSMNVQYHIADAGNTIKIGDTTGGATIQAGGIQVQGGAINIDGSQTNRSSIYSGNNPIFNNGFSVIALSERNADTDYRKHNLENTVTIKNTDLNADNYMSGSDIIGGKVQITNSNIKTNGYFEMYARSARQGDTIFAGSDNSLTLENVRLNINGDATIRSGKVQITDSAISSNSIVDVMAFSERHNPDSINTTTTNDSNNSIVLENAELYGEYSTRIRGGKVEITDSDISANGSLIIRAYSKRTTSGNDGNDSAMTAGSDNSIVLKKTILSGGAYDGMATEIMGGKVEISGSTINTTDDINIVAANSVETNGNFSNSAFKADVNNTLNVNNSSITAAGYSRLRGLGGAIDISGSRLESYGVGLAAFEEMKNDQTSLPHDTYFIGESSSKSGAGSNVTLQGNTSIVAASGIQILGGSIKVNESSIAASGELGVNISAVNNYANSESKREQTYEHNSKNIIEISNGSSITNTNDNGSIMMYGGVINNNGTINANKGSAGAIALVELKGSGTLTGAGGVIKFSGKDMAAGDYDYTWQGQTLAVTVEMDNPDKPQPTWTTSWDANGNPTKTIIYLKSALPPQDVDKNTPNDEVMKSIDNVFENAATKDEAFQAIETIFANIQGKSEQEKREIASHLMDTAKQQGFDESDVAKAAIDGDGGTGTFTSNLSEANNEMSKENNVQQQSGETNVNGTTQSTQNNDQTTSNNEISSGVSLEGEKLDDN